MSKQYEAVQGDRWDLIAYRLYGDESRMVDLLKRNPALAGVNVLEAGMVIEYEPDDGVRRAPAPPWRREGGGTP